eukprot:CAMPEP_0113894800 /NCGR_PEP_ID=MMETSP0780_2-20120614/16956_1 /TAXON_ID=652834 /ORGANISM="Palpitomonas bilix" /LENGTH=288 /DNA_ID=CAMNT_0000885455 /DNA_START=129 /DNA_END=995 /DNA_ORIENTATION=+ /assembly_acc=CAM_ASM_000599
MKVKRRAGCVVTYHSEARQEYILLISSSSYQAWVLPAGGIEPGETEVEAAKREVVEEAHSSGDILYKVGNVFDGLKNTNTAWYTIQCKRAPLFPQEEEQGSFEPFPTEVPSDKPPKMARWWKRDEARKQLQWRPLMWGVCAVHPKKVVATAISLPLSAQPGNNRADQNGKVQRLDVSVAIDGSALCISFGFSASTIVPFTVIFVNAGTTSCSVRVQSENHITAEIEGQQLPIPVVMVGKKERASGRGDCGCFTFEADMSERLLSSCDTVELTCGDIQDRKRLVPLLKE